MDKASLITFFDALAPEWDRLYPASPARLRCLCELTIQTPGARILDVACGVGMLEPFLLEKSPVQVLAVDLSPRMIEEAQKKCADPRVEFLCRDVMELNTGEFDCAILCDAFQHFENRGSLIRQMHHLIVPGGRLTICCIDGRATVNSHHKANAAELSMALPTAQTLAASMASCFDVDTLIDSSSLYVVSGIRLHG